MNHFPSEVMTISLVLDSGADTGAGLWKPEDPSQQTHNGPTRNLKITAYLTAYRQ